MTDYPNNISAKLEIIKASEITPKEVRYLLPRFNSAGGGGDRLIFIKEDDYEVRVLISGLIQQHRSYDAETNGQINSLALRLCDIAEAMKPGRKKKIPFEPVEIRVICQCLMEWRNREIQAKRHGAVDAINELLIRFTR